MTVLGYHSTGVADYRHRRAVSGYWSSGMTDMAPPVLRIPPLSAEQADAIARVVSRLFRTFGLG